MTEKISLENSSADLQKVDKEFYIAKHAYVNLVQVYEEERKHFSNLNFN